MKILFWSRKSRSKTMQRSTLICRITVAGSEPVEFSTHLYPQSWDKAKKKAKGISSQSINAEIVRIENELHEIWRDLERRKVAYTSQTVMELYKAVTPVTKKLTWLDVMEAYKERYEQRHLAGLCSKKRKDNIVYVFLNVSKFLHDCLKSPKMLASEIEEDHFEKAQMYFLNGLEMSWNYTALILETTHSAILWAVRKKWITSDPWLDCSMVRKVNEDKLLFLTAEQLGAFEALPTDAVRERLKDAVLFLAYTGLSHVDYKALVNDALVNDAGELWLDGKRGKSKTPYHVPVFYFPKLEALIAKYGCLEKIPKFSNDYLNDTMKAFFQELGFPNAQAYSCHDMRRTFAQICYDKGFEDSTIAKMLGQKNTTITHRHYIHTTRESIRVKLGLS